MGKRLSYLNILLPPAQFSRCLLGSHRTGWQQHSGWEKGSWNHQSILCEATVWSSVFDFSLWHEDVNNGSECMKKAGKQKKKTFNFYWLWTIPVEHRLFQSFVFNFTHKHITKTLLKPFCYELTLCCCIKARIHLTNPINK